MDVTVYSPDAPCVKCSLTKREFSKAGIPFTAVVATDGQIAQFKADGHAAFPVVTVDCGDGATWTWSDFRRDNIERLKELWQNDGPLLAA